MKIVFERGKSGETKFLWGQAIIVASSILVLIVTAIYSYLYPTWFNISSMPDVYIYTAIIVIASLATGIGVGQILLYSGVSKNGKVIYEESKDKTEGVNTK